jgi:hypothetical protein
VFTVVFRKPEDVNPRVLFCKQKFHSQSVNRLLQLKTLFAYKNSFTVHTFSSSIKLKKKNISITIVYDLRDVYGWEVLHDFVL